MNHKDIEIEFREVDFLNFYNFHFWENDNKNKYFLKTIKEIYSDLQYFYDNLEYLKFYDDDDEYWPKGTDDYNFVLFKEDYEKLGKYLVNKKLKDNLEEKLPSKDIKTKKEKI